MTRVLILAVLSLIASVSCEITFSLDSGDLKGPWTLQNQNKSVKTGGRVPGGVYSDLFDNGVLDNSVPLFYRSNDLGYRWVSLDNWTYSRSFDIPEEFLAKTVVNLVLHGVDTIGEVVLNDQVLGSVDNMFIRYIFPIKGIAKNKGNVIEVRLVSPVLAAAAAAKNRGYPVLPDCVPDEYQGECHANMLRKMQASFAWDWGPAFPSVGVWKSVEIEAFDVGVIRDISFTTERFQAEKPMVRYTIGFHADLATENYNGVIITGVRFLGKNQQKFKTAKIKDDENNGNYSLTYFIEDEVEEALIRLWWPNGYGNQQMNEIYAQLQTYDNNPSNETVYKRVRSAFRTVELIQEPLKNDSDGLSFYFKVNGVPIFAKGSNWIPGHVLPELGYEPDAIRHLLLSAKEANMNMLRVWGGGVYESDTFYSIADELGILIWQDMMFACSMYPTEERFLESVRTEVEQQVRRLQHHPSVAVWAGNNENEAALRGNWYGTEKSFDTYKNDYIKLYVDVIKDVVQATDSTRSYVVSSPSNGINSETQGYVADDPYSPLYGDVHYYNYVSDGWNSFTFPDTRFASEYGFQAMPSFLSIKAVSQSSDWGINSSFTKLRQHHPNGYSEMLAQIQLHFSLPKVDDSVEFFEKFIYYSQIYQAIATKTETEKYRRDRSKLTDSNKGNTMGALYWQLNDVWEAPTWSSIEYNGRWKMLHYLAKNFFAPIIISPEVTPASELNIYLVSDILEDIYDATINVSAVPYSSFDQKNLFSLNNVTVKKSASDLIISKPNLAELLSVVNCSINTCFIHFSLSAEEQILSENVYFPSSFASVSFPHSNIKVKLDDVTGTKAQLYVTADSPALFVWLETKVPGVFSENGFTLTNSEKIISFETRGEPINKQEFVDSLTIRDLNSPPTSPVSSGTTKLTSLFPVSILALIKILF